MSKEKLKCSNCGMQKGEPIYKFDGKLYCTICYLDILRNKGYIEENDFIGFGGEVEE